MSIKRNIDGSQIVANRNLILGQTVFLCTSNGIQTMNVNGCASGDITVIWNGIEDTGDDWTVSGDVGTETSKSAHAGTKGLDTGLMNNDDELFFTNSIDIDPDGYSQLSFWILPKAAPGNTQPKIRWKTIEGSNKGNELDLNSYITNWDLDVWQKITIPMIDFGINTDDNIGMLAIKFHNSGQHFWIDNFELKAPGEDGPFIYRVEAPDENTYYHVSVITLILIGPSTDWDSTNFVNIAKLNNGLLLRQRRLSTGEILWSFNSRDNIDLFGRFHPQDDILFADDNLLVGFMIKPGKISIIVSNDDVLEIIIRDNLTSISSIRAYCHYGVENLSS